jgi:pyrroline-5-carboxylate reductase
VTRLLIVGGGSIGAALLGGLVKSGWVEPGELAVAERLDDTRHELASIYPGVLVCADLVHADSAVLAVKPADGQAAAQAIAKVGIKRVLSIMAGVPLSSLRSWLGHETTILRAMPNLPAVLGAGASALSGDATVAEEDFDWGEAVLSCFGVVARVPEKLLDSVTGLSGSGPAYVFLFAEALIEAGVAQGLDRTVSRLLVTETLLGSARLLSETGHPPEVLRGSVTSPGGATAAGLRVLEKNAVRSALIEAVAAATERSRELGHS